MANNKAIEDALERILQCRKAEKEKNQPEGGHSVEDPRLDKPPFKSDSNSNPSEDDSKNDTNSSSTSDISADDSVDDSSGGSNSDVKDASGKNRSNGGGGGADSNEDTDDLPDDMKSHTPQIGDTGNAAIQAAEEAERQANAYKEDAEKKADNAENPAAEDAANDLADDAKKVADDAKNLKKDIQQNGVGDEEKKRLQRIADAFADLQNQRDALDETDKAVFSSRQLVADKKRRKEYYKNANKPIEKAFIDSVYLFIKNQTAYLRTPSWSRFSKRYVDSSPLLQKGKARTNNNKIPLLNVYFDRSASWDDQKIKAGQSAVAALKQFEKKKLIKINIYYFSDIVSSSPEDMTQGTGATQLILDHIQATHADNVIIMTDSDMDYQGEFTHAVTVSGAVWFVFVGGTCQRLMRYLRGKQLTKAFELA